MSMGDQEKLPAFMLRLNERNNLVSPWRNHSQKTIGKGPAHVGATSAIANGFSSAHWVPWSASVAVCPHPVITISSLPVLV